MSKPCSPVWFKKEKKHNAAVFYFSVKINNILEDFAFYCLPKCPYANTSLYSVTYLVAQFVVKFLY